MASLCPLTLQPTQNNIKVIWFLLLVIATVCTSDKLTDVYDHIFQPSSLNHWFSDSSTDLSITQADVDDYNNGFNNEDVDLNITQLIEKYGFSVEQYNVVSADKYVLRLFRIPGSGPVVFLMHGTYSSADDFITPGPDNGLGLLLAARGYDVWMGNARGTKHSFKNLHLNSSEQAYWDFTWHEIALYDLPEMIDFVLAKTNLTSLTYIGHSQGTTVFFVMCSALPDYNKKIKLMIALSPVTWLSNSTSPFFKSIAPVSEEIYPLLSSLGIYSFFSNSSLSLYLQRILCKNVTLAFLICENAFFFVSGYNYSQVNFGRLPAIYSHTPTGASVKQVLHYLQLYKSGYFRQFDYGVDNILKYGTPEPPSYPVKMITAPVALFFGRGDWLTVKRDIEILKSNLPNVVNFYTVPNENFCHIDFILAKDLKFLILPNVINLIEQYKNNTSS